jgi:hypothetical protein
MTVPWVHGSSSRVGTIDIDESDVVVGQRQGATARDLPFGSPGLFCVYGVTPVAGVQITYMWNVAASQTLLDYRTQNVRRNSTPTGTSRSRESERGVRR